ncbi:hypothetical protein MNBD_ALPHA09-440 [hydrothermal vent metagenome]|uniref:Methyltransferase FkbM domain-containing protein n=1 Tax=hydrothermal vent metagenome TaxID=652676 RepID=A0A3B0TL38_9ZZZZ
MKAKPSNLQQILLKGIEHHEGGRLDKAEAAFRDALKIDPGQPIALYIRGRMAQEAERHEEAAQLLKKSLARRADHVEGHFFLGEALTALGRFDDAAAAYAGALAINARFPQGHRRLGDALTRANRAEEAVASIHRALAIEPNQAASHFSLGVAQEALGQIDGALESYRRALGIDPGLTEAARHRDRLLEGIETSADKMAPELPPEPDPADPADDGVLFDQGNLRLRQCRYGRMLYFVNDDYIGRALDLYGEFSEAEAALFRQIVGPGMTAVDIGANLGVHALALARSVMPGGSVLALEPQRVVFQMLCANVANNGLTNVRALHAASGREEGMIKVPELNFDAGGNFGGMSLVDAGWGENVPVMPLDRLTLGACDFIKIDVEGMETDVVAGAEATIGKFRPVLYVENERQEKSAALIGRIFDLDYRLFWHVPPLFNPDNFRGKTENVFPRQGSVNMIGVPREMEIALGGFTEILSVDDHWK